jgi:predicted  nucleic acid-binding Zn-ribbon protein
MPVLDTLGGILGGGVAGVIGKHLRDMYVARLRNIEEMAKQEAERERGEREESVQFATMAADERRRFEAKLDAHNARIIDLTEKVARCETQHAAVQRQYEEERSERLSLADDIRALKCHVDLQQQLIEKQREQIDRLVRTLVERDAAA